MPDIASCFLDCLDRAETRAAPFRHWLLSRMLPADACDAIVALPIDACIHGDTMGKRETNNSLRVFFDRTRQADHPVCADLARALQDGPVVRRLESLCGAALAGSFLRIEYCLDTDGFWLEPHTDIGAKRFTMLMYLSDTPGCEAWGTDLMDAGGTVIATTPYHRNDGCIFIPGEDTWHGFRRRPIDGVRRSLIVNYVVPEWRSRHELAFPDIAVRT
ncbi:MAG TPA: 2OG-Fe(II) oxygenase [Rhodopila sp.]|uniref:2OG-Fe(II) oxygenase n=1 Tax=Rhodopila sp. TaxID=2480087 RepID=UPI002CF3643D|nr:2OG-Fe(II) oxygenase [Rhodopila sp.]HVY17206.1 2OG-Fe(II) oxygenase [Rhodopila sp.]